MMRGDIENGHLCVDRRQQMSWHRIKSDSVGPAYFIYVIIGRLTYREGNRLDVCQSAIDGANMQH